MDRQMHFPVHSPHKTWETIDKYDTVRNDPAEPESS